MIIVMTNRILKNIPNNQAKTIPISDVGEVLGVRAGDEDILRTGLLLAEKNEIQFSEKGNEEEIFKNIQDSELNNSWVFFMHGFNQTIQSSITKAQKLSKSHNVNVVLFSWPSRPISVPADDNSVFIKILKSALTGNFAVSILKDLALSKVKVFIKNKWENYPPAIKNAEQSHADFMEAITLVKNNLNSNKKPVLIVHSMGNYLLQCALEKNAKLPMSFNNIILHQADVNSENHDWVKQLNDNLLDSAKLYITINAPDYVLAASSVRRKILRQKPTERLGQTRHHYIVDSNVNYIDCTGGPGISNRHEFFKFDRADISHNKHYYDWFNRVFNAVPDGLPNVNSESLSGFSKMPTQISLYRLEKIFDPVDGEFNDDYEDELVKSLDWFEDPLVPDAAIEDEELLDDDYI